MKSIFSLLLLVFFFQNILAVTEQDITILGFADSQYNGCFNEQEGPFFGFTLHVKASGFKEETNWQLRLDDKFTFANCGVYPPSDPSATESEQYVTCAVNITMFPLKKVVLPAEYSPYKTESWTVTDWSVIANKEILTEQCYPKYSYKFVPDSTEKHLVECDAAGNNKVTIYGSLTLPQSQNLRRLGSEPLQFSPILIVDGVLAYANCEVDPNTDENSNDNQMVCAIDGKSYFQFFATISSESVERTPFLVEDSNKMQLKTCEPATTSSSFLKFGGILLASLLLL